MKHLTFDDVRHNGSGRYAIDWEKGERKYKAPIHGLHVYEHGMVELSRNGYRDPYWRGHIAKQFDIHLLPCREIIGLALSDPDGNKVIKSGLVADSIFLHHRELNRLYATAKWGKEKIQFLSEHAQPISSLPVQTFKRRPKEEAAVYVALAEHLALGETMVALGTTSRRGMYGYYKVPDVARDLILNRGGDLTSDSVREACMYMAKHGSYFDKEVQQLCGITEKHQYLNVKEK